MRVPDFDSLKIPFFLRSDNQYIVKSADFSGWIASPFRAFERSFVHRCKQVGWIIAKVRKSLGESWKVCTPYTGATTNFQSSERVLDSLPLKVLRAKNLRVLRAGFRRKDARGETIVPLKAWIRLNVACRRTVSGPVGSAGHIPFWYFPNKSLPLLQNLAFITNIRKKSSWITGSFHHLEAVFELFVWRLRANSFPAAHLGNPNKFDCLWFGRWVESDKLQFRWKRLKC